ncbi:hypothetical protein EV363DRAFT_1443556 [Boletus edulis]|nr:hypothetical protein EV363DRAFT_1443556 [Boletus edulis]
MSLSPGPLENSLNLTNFDDQSQFQSSSQYQIPAQSSQFQLPSQIQIPANSSQFQSSSQYQIPAQSSQFQPLSQYQVPPQASQFQQPSQIQASYSSSSNNSIFPTHWTQSFHVNQHTQQQRIEALEEIVTRLRIENAAIEASRATIEKSYNLLVAQLNRSMTSNEVSAGAIDITLQTPVGEASSFLKPEALPKLKATDYPHVCFWTEKKWSEWKESDAGQASSSNHSFLEDARGQLLSETRVASILSNMRDLWHEFRTRKLIDASMTWKSMPLGTKKTFRSEIIKSFPELNLCEDAWKVDKLAKRHYASYKQTWFTNKSDDKATSGSKRKMKAEPDTNNVDTVELTAKRFKTGDTTSKTTRTRSHTDNDCQRSPSAVSDLSVMPPVAATNSGSSSLSSSLPSSPVLPSAVAISAANGGSSSSLAASSTQSSPIIPPAVAIGAGSSSSLAASSAQSSPIVPPSATFNSSPSSSSSPNSPVVPIVSPAIDSSSPSSPVLPPPVVINTNSSESLPSSIRVLSPPAAIDSSPSSESSGSSSSFVLLPTDSTFLSTEDVDSGAIRQASIKPRLVVRVKNPLFSVDRELPAMKNVNQTMPTQSNAVDSSETPHTERPAVPPEPSAKPNQAIEPQVSLVANTNKPQVADVTVTAATVTTETTTGGAQSTTVKKGTSNWRPSSAKTGRNLCAHRWLKRISFGGTREEFGTYYDSLSAELKARYKDEAAKLVSDGVWVNGTAEVITKVASLPMHTG